MISPGKASASPGPASLADKQTISYRLLEQSHDGLRRLGGQAQRCGTQALSGLEHQHVGTFLVQVGVDQRGRTILEGIDHLRGELLARGDRAQLVGQGLGGCPHRHHEHHQALRYPS